MADDIRELNALIADYGREFQSPDPRSGPSLASARLYNADYQPMTSAEQAEMALSMIPGVGEGLDVAYIAQGIEEEDLGKAGTGLAGLALPFVGAGTIKQIAKKLEIDNPGGSWLRDKKEEAAEAMAKAEPNTYRKNLGTTAITGYHKGVIELDPKQLADVPGAMGEEASRTSSRKLANLQKSIEQEGYNPSPIMIHVREDGKPFIVEGNTRVAEAIISDRPTIQAEIKYLRGAEEVEGPLSPDKIFEMPDRAKSKSVEFREGPPIKIGDTMQSSLLTSDGETPEVLYRIVSRKEFDKAQESGKFTPSSFYGRIHASSSPDMRYKNAPDDVVIEIKYDPDDGWYSKQSSDEVYGVTKKDIPISRISKIKQFKKGGSVVERPNNYEPKAI